MPQRPSIYTGEATYYRGQITFWVEIVDPRKRADPAKSASLGTIDELSGTSQGRRQG